MSLLSFRWNGLKEMEARMKGNDLYARAWKRALGRISMNVKKQIRSQAPVASGRTARGVYYRMPKVVLPLWSVVSDRAKRKGVRYPFVVNAGHRRTSRSDVQLHFRGTGQSTKGWFERAAAGAQKYINQALATATMQVVAKFEGRNEG